MLFTESEILLALKKVSETIESRRWGDDVWISLSPVLDLNVTKNKLTDKHYSYGAILYRVSCGKTITGDYQTLVRFESAWDIGINTGKLSSLQIDGIADLIESYAEGLLDDDGADHKACHDLAEEVAEYLRGKVL